MENTSPYPEIVWELGTAYDFFVSLMVLHKPADFGLRSAWAAGMRQRLPSKDREVLETFQNSLDPLPPLQWLHSLPEPKDGATLLDAMKDLSSLDRFYVLIGLDEYDPEFREFLKEISVRGKWGEDDLIKLDNYEKEMAENLSREYLSKKLDIFSSGEEFGEKILGSLSSYYEFFFFEEERRILPALKDGLSQAQGYSKNHTFPELFEKLSQGVKFSKEKFPGAVSIVMTPSFWISPFILYTKENPIFLFGARPENISLVPGELVPDALLTALAALSDPTRLRILRYLSSESLTPTQLASRLRLRPPTVTHHLKNLRAAGLITIIPGGQKKEVHYQTRTEKMGMIHDLLNQFVTGLDE